ncbi:MAG: cation-transporting P-type ATPase, partial [Mycolicibacterium sp.]
MEVTVDATRDPSIRDGAEVARHLAVDPATGLASAEAERRLQRDGPNELRAKAPVPMWRKVVRQFQDPLIYLLLVAVAISTAAWLAEGATGAPIDALVISAIVALNGALGFIQESRAEAAVKALQSMTAAT